MLWAATTGGPTFLFARIYTLLTRVCVLVSGCRNPGFENFPHYESEMSGCDSASLTATNREESHSKYRCKSGSAAVAE